MRIKLDENLPESAVQGFRDAGHEVDTAHAEGLQGSDDPDVLRAATDDGRLLVTLDRGLGDVRRYPPETHAGVHVLRLDHQSPRAVGREIDLISTGGFLDDLEDASQSGATETFEYAAGRLVARGASDG